MFFLQHLSDDEKQRRWGNCEFPDTELGCRSGNLSLLQSGYIVKQVRRQMCGLILDFLLMDINEGSCEETVD